MSETWTILKVLDWTRGWFERKSMDSPRLDAEVLIAHALGMERVMLYAHFDQPLSAADLNKIRGLVKRRGEGEPVAYLVGEREFWSLTFEVGPDVLVPRPDTEVLVEEAKKLAGDKAPERIADVGTGSGCVAIALATELPGSRVFALDVSVQACAIAARNVARHDLGGRVDVVESDLLAGLTEDVDLIVANLPYIRSAEIAGLPADVRDHEPHLALDGGGDGLDAIRALVDAAPARLGERGAIALEAGHDQIDDVCRILESGGFTDVQARIDYGGNPRVATGKRA